MSNSNTSNTSSSYVDLGVPHSPRSDASSTSSNLLVSETVRPIIISSSTTAGATFVRISVPFEPSAAWITAEVVRDEFHRYLAKHQNEDASINVEQETQASQDAAEGGQGDTAKAAAASTAARVILLSKFLGFLSLKLRATDPARVSHEVEVLHRAWLQFQADFVSAKGDVHSLVLSTIDIDQRPSVLRNYYEAFSILEKLGKTDFKALQTVKLFDLAEQDKAKAFAIFGGQGNNEIYFDELQTLFDTYRPFVEELLHKSSLALLALADEATVNGFSTFYQHGLDVLGWLQHPATRPPVSYTASIPLSLPLIGLTQLTQYLVSCRCSGLHPGEMRERLAGGSTGHSQGIISAVVVSSSSSLESFYANVVKALGLLFNIGKRGQEAFPARTLEPALVADAVEGGEGEPTPMLSVTGLPQKALEAHLKKTNVHLKAEEQVNISLFNSRRNFVVTGPPRSLFGLVGQMRVARAESGQDQSKIAHSKRKPAFNMRFLPVGVPYHSAYLQGATEKVSETDYKGAELWSASELNLAVLNTFDGSDMRGYGSESLVKSLSEQIFTQPIYWDKATDVSKDVTHIIDFGTGGMSGIGGLTARNLEGRGVRVIVPSGTHSGSSELYSSAAVKFEPRWEDAFMPRLVKNAEGKLLIDTPYSRLTSRKPLLIAGMTPTTVQPGLLIAAAKAGANAEIAGGGHYSPKSMLAKVQTIQKATPPGSGQSWNALFINPRHFPWQLSEWCSLRKQGYPLDAWTTAAGIPSTEKSREIVAQLKDAGIEHMTLKPGSTDGIRQTCAIAAANPDFNFVLNWTGGRAGGHHSYEDVFQPIVSTYALIRKYPNIALLAGSGLGDAESVWPWMSGEWSSQFGLPPMPFDGALLASRVMVAKEAHTSPAVKQLIVDAKGVEDLEWEGTYDKETGGILTVTSELGEPIHKIATRGVKLWNQLDKKLFTLNKDKRNAWLADPKNAKWVKESLNADFQKPWFPAKIDGTMCDDLADMTYEEVTRRLFRLVYVHHQKRFIDRSYVSLLGDWIRRVEERFAGIDLRQGQKMSMLQSYSTLQEDPNSVLDSFFAEYPDAREYWISAEDVAFFLQLCQRRGQKPVPFVPVLDEGLQTWFKKDSLWFAEDIDAVFDQDAQRVCILQGPVAVKYCKKVDEPLADILGEIDDGIIERLLQKYYGGDPSKVPSVDYLGKSPRALDVGLLSRHGITSAVQQSGTGGTVRTLRVGASLPKAEDWLEYLAGDRFSWLRALLCSVSIVQETNFADNPLARIAAPRTNQTVQLRYDAQGEPEGLIIKGCARAFGHHDPDFTVVDVSRVAGSSRIAVTLFEERLGEAVPLELLFDYVPGSPKQIHEVMSDRADRIKKFYWKLWFREEMPDAAALAATKEHTGNSKKLEEATVREFVQSYGQSFQSGGQAPMDIAIVLGWEGIMKALIAATGSADLLRLVHLSNSFRVVDGARPLRVGDEVSSRASVESIKISETGKTIAVKGVVVRDGKAIIEVVSAFFFRGKFNDYSTCFETSSEEYSVQIKSQADASVLLAKEWFEWISSSPLTAGTTLEFRIANDVRFKDSNSFSSVNVVGAAYIRDYRDELVKVGNVSYEADSVSYGNAVTAWMQRVSGKASGPIPLENGGYTIAAAPGHNESKFVAPPSNETYTLASGDSNPIHISPVFADFAGLPTTICHGMRQSAVVNAMVSSIAAEGHGNRCLSWQATFLGMVSPGDELTITLRHVAMRDGHKIIKAEAKNQDGDKVLEGTATVAQPPSFYCFTGQGSQETGMGMDLYNSSEHAKALWDEADAHLQQELGLSILEIVRENPKSKTVYFGGIKGHQIRQRYQEFTYESIDESGNSVTLPLFPEITPTSQSYTFFHPSGVLNQTSFTQAALVLMELAAFQDLQRKGMVVPTACFGGHSLGEYSALASVAKCLSVCDLVDTVFYRGLVMGRAVKRDELGRSNYGMMACSPARVGLSDPHLQEIVTAIEAESGKLLQIVNWNVATTQLVLAGELITLHTLTQTLNWLKVKKIDVKQLSQSMDEAQLREHLSEIVKGHYAAALEDQTAQGGRVELQRGFCTIPLPGIDVPFHSRYLMGGVGPFRNYLSKKLNWRNIKPTTLIGRYIPNLVAQPFRTDKDWVELVYNQSNSARLARVLRDWEKEGWGEEENLQRLTTVLVIELLAYQFASPVRWIETQDVFFSEPFSIDRLVEFGPAPTLKGMAERTHKLKYAAADQAHGKRRVFLSSAKDKEAIYYAFADEEVAEETAPAPAADSSAPAPAAAAPLAAAAPPPPAAGGGGPAQSVPDEPLKATDTVRAILAQKLKKSLGEIQLSKAIKDMTGGKSTLSNELVGDLQLEFPAGLPERGEELPLEELGSALNTGYSGTLGKHTAGLVTKLINSKMPGGFNLTSVKAHLQKNWGLGPGRTDGVLLVAITQEPAKRLGSEPEAKVWLDSCVSAYSTASGVSLSQGGGASGGGGGGGGATISSEELEKIEGRHNAHAQQQIELFERFLGAERRADGRRADATAHELQALTDKFDLIKTEHGDAYLDGVLPKFSAAKARNFSSYWNWSRQDAMLMFYDIIYGRLRSVDREISARCLSLFSRADGPALLELMQYTIDRVDASQGPTYELAKEFGQQLIENIKEIMSSPPRFKEVFACTAPKTEIDAKGNIVFREVKRDGVRKAMEGFVKEQAQGTRVSGNSVDLALAAQNAKKLYALVRNEPSVSKFNKSTVKGLYNEVARALGQPRQTPQRIAGPRGGRRGSSLAAQRPAAPFDAAPPTEARQSLLSIKRQVGGVWQTSQKLTSVFFSVLEDFASEGMTFEGRNVLITGAGRGSIAVEVLKGLLAGGARCVVTTSSYSRKTVEFYQSIYQKVGARGSTLTVVPFNAASKSDVEALVDYIYTTMQLDLDVCIPFAAIPEKGMDISELGDKSELAHRALLINVLRLLGAIKAIKAKRGITTRPTLCVVPLSPNQGQMGFDGTYSESKIGLTTLANRWSSEGWSDYLSISGAIIGWTRTGLMDANNIVAQEVEKLGMRTYSCAEMAFSILGLLSPAMFAQATVEPIHADLTGGFGSIPNLAEATGKIRKSIQDEAAKRRAIALDSAADFKVVQGAAAEALHQTVKVEPRSHFRFEHVFDKWTLDQHKRIAKLSSELSGEELEQTVVVTGFAEVSPYGSTRSRWQFEAYGTLTIEATIELAWIMGLIKHHSGPLKTGKQYVGWVDAASGEPVEDSEMKQKYEQEILAHTGVRLIEPSLFKGYDPKKKGYTQEIELTEDMPTFEATEEEAVKFVNEHGEKGVDIWKNESGSWVVQLKKGARVLVPKSVVFSRSVAGQMPTGWVATRYGVPDELAKNIDRIGLWIIVCAAEALIMSGISDPFELYEHMHLSEVGNAIGSGMGGMQSLQAIFAERRAEKDPAKDVLQESFINVPAAWVNLLLLSAAGPITPTVGACATGLQSITVAADAIKTGKAKVMLCGGVDDFSEEGSMEFSLMQATSNAEEEFKAGREPSEMSRPTTTTRAGFMESQGGGVQILMSAATAIKLGAPIQGIIAHASTHTDKQGRSIPAPGRGVMSAATKLQATLASWGLTADDIGAASIHGTSTKANDKNESHCYHTMLERMGRTPHNALPISAQKSVLGHSKGGAATWAFNGCLQMLHTSTVAGNRNADDISPELQKYSYILYPSTSIQRTPEDLNATLLTSFGFGQVGGVILTLHPSHLLGRMNEDSYAKYRTLRRSRQALTYSRMHSAFTNNDLVRVKSDPPFAVEDEDAVLLNTNARASKVGNTWKFVKPFAAAPALVPAATAPTPRKSAASAQQEATLQASLGAASGIGIDIEDVESFPSENETFLTRNFTEAEISYCQSQPNPKASFTGRFAAKEAVFKSLGVASKGSAAPMKEIEVLSTPEGPRVNLTGEAQTAAQGARFLVSISHADNNAVAIAHRLPSA